MVVGSSFGTAGAKLLLSGAGIALAPVSKGGSILAAGGINGSLSAYITRKMGWDYVEQLLDKKMNIGKQALSASITLGVPYAAPKIWNNAVPAIADGVVDGLKTGINAAATSMNIDTSQITDAISNINSVIDYEKIKQCLPKEDMQFIGKLIKDLPKAQLNKTSQTFGCVITGCLTANILTSFVENKKPPTLGEILRESLCITLASTLLGTSIEDMSKPEIKKIVDETASEYHKFINIDPKTFLPIENAFDKELAAQLNYPINQITAINNETTEKLIRVCGTVGLDLNEFCKTTAPKLKTIYKNLTTKQYEHLTNAGTLLTLGLSAQSSHKDEEAKTYLSGAFRIRKAVLGDDNPLTKDALELFVSIDRSKLNEKNKEALINSDVLYDCGVSSLKQGDKKEANMYLSGAYRIRKAILGENHFESQYTLEKLNSLK